MVQGSKARSRGLRKVIFLSLIEHVSEPFFPLDEGIIRYRLGDVWINPGPGYLKAVPKLLVRTI